MSGDDKAEPQSPPPSRPATEEEIAEWAAKNPPPPGEVNVLLHVPLIPASAWIALYSDLLETAHHEKQGFEDPDTPPGFMATKLALLAVVSFLQSFDGLLQAGATTPLYRLSVALQDIQEGRKPPLLAPRKGTNPGTDRTQARVQGFAALAMNELMKAGDTARSASDKVCAAIKKGRCRGWQKIDQNTVKNWRYRCEEGKPATVRPRISHDAQRIYSEGLPPGMGATPAKRAEILLFMLSAGSMRGMG